MAENLVLPVPEVLSAVCLVPTALDGAAASERTLAALPSYVPGPVGTVARKMLEAGAVEVAALRSSALPPVPTELQEHLGVARELIRAVVGADAFAMFTAAWPPGWPPVHESAARACAAALAADLAVPLVDGFVPEILAAEQAIATLPGADYKIRLTDWVLVSQSAEPSGLWTTTKGLERFGLAELQVRNVPPQLGGLWASVLNGVSSRLLDLWLDALRERGGAAFAEVPAEFAVSAADIAEASGEAPGVGGSALVRLMLDPAHDDQADSFLTVQPPDDYPGSAGEYMSTVAMQIFGDPGRDVRFVPPGAAMEQAVKAARETLPAARARFLDDKLPPGARLMVKHRLTTPAGPEYPWAYVNSWADPAKILASSAADALHDPRVRSGRPLVIDADTVVDWAIWTDGRGIVEGGRTNAIALSEGEPGRR